MRWVRNLENSIICLRCGGGTCLRSRTKSLEYKVTRLRSKVRHLENTVKSLGGGNITHLRSRVRSLENRVKCLRSRVRCLKKWDHKFEVQKFGN